ncbi:MAG: endonuclease/exonuclease/phosphatase family protein, partial [Verrucomicrobia bacterium]|nr:endonuclease/exonuclease/phosphatase family protein [Verrucomicrobiota bacterium]
MSMEIDDLFLDLSSKCAEPLCWAYGLLRYRVVAPLAPNQFANYDNTIVEIAYRCLIVVGAVLAAASIVVPVALILLAVASKVLRAIGFALQKNHYTHIRGLAPEKELQNGVHVMTWNVCGIGGGMPYDHGGVVDWRLRLDPIVEKILAEDPDVLVLQEIYDTALAEALIARLQEHYAHFFAHLGANVLGSVGGCMVLSKCAVHRFTNTSFTNNRWTLNRTFATLEVKARPEDSQPCARLIGTHLIHDDNAARMVQMNQIVESLRNAPALPTLLMGDLNLERDVAEQGGILTPYFENGYQGTEPTRTNQMLKQWNEDLVDPGDVIDYISLYRAHGPAVSLQNTHLVRAFDETFNTRTALSDHHGLAAR